MDFAHWLLLFWTTVIFGVEIAPDQGTPYLAISRGAFLDRVGER